MSIRIEVTGESLPEVADKLLAIGASLRNTASYDADNAAREAEDKPKRGHTEAEAKKTRKTKDKVDEPAADAGNAAQSAADPSPTSNSAQDTQTAETAQSPSEPAELDFEKDVAPVVIDAVGKIGKEGVTGVLSQFGANRASEVDPAQWGELVDALKAAL